MTIGEKTRLKLTYADYLTTPEDKRYELLDGELLMPPAPSEAHQRSQAQLGIRLGVYINEKKIGRVYFAPTDVVLSDIDVVQPDLLFVSNERMHVITPAGVRGAPDLVVEILSMARLSRARQGIQTPCAVRLMAKRRQRVLDRGFLTLTDAGGVTVLLLGDDGYEVVYTFGEGDTLTSPTLEGFRLEVDDVFGV